MLAKKCEKNVVRFSKAEEREGVKVLKFPPTAFNDHF